MKKRILISVITVILSIIFILGGWIIYDSLTEYSKNKQAVQETESSEFSDTIELDVTFISLESSWNMAMSSMISQFEEDHPDITINYKVYNETGLYEDTINKLYARGELGDVVEMLTPAVYARNDVLFPIPDVLTDETRFTSSYEGEVYGIGTVGYTTGIIYNKRMFEKFGISVPQTYDEFLQVCQTLQEHGVTPMVVGGANDWHLAFLLNHFLRTDVLEQKPDWLSQLQLGQVSWTDTQPQQMITQMTELINSGYVDSLWETIPDSSIAAMMADESVAMVYSGGWMINDIENISANVDIGWFFLPDEDGKIAVENQVGGYWTLTKECGEDNEKLAAATAFLQYFYSEGIYEEMCTSVTGISILNRQVEPDYTEQQQQVWDSYETADYKYTEDLSSSFIPQEFRKELFSTIKDVLEQRNDTEEASLRIQESWLESTEGKNEKD